jgi:hypothetical protein
MNKYSSRFRIAAPFGLVMAVILFALSATPALCYTNSITLTNTQSLAFGSFIAGSGGTMAVSTSGGRSVGSGSIVLMNMNPTAHAAAFNVTGDANAPYTITLPADGVVSLTGPGAAMAVGSFTSNPTSAGTLNSGGTGTIAVGATLTVGSNQVPGSYSGSFSVTVTYQ